MSIVAVILCLGAALGAAACSDTVEGDYKIGILQMVEHPALDNAREGFMAELTELMKQEGKTVGYDYKNAQNDSSMMTNILDRFVSIRRDMVFAIGTGAAKIAAHKTKEANIPTMFTAVSNPLDIVDSIEKPGGNTTGTSDLADLGEQLQLIIDLFDGTKSVTEIKVGMMYTTREENSLWQINQMKGMIAAKNMPEPVVKGINELSDIKAAVDALKTCDVVFIPTDNMIANGIEAVKSANNDPTSGAKLPIVCGDIDMTAACGIATVGVDFNKLGRQTARMAFEVLVHGKDPANYPVQYMENCDLHVFQENAASIGFTIPQKVLDQLAA